MKMNLFKDEETQIYGYSDEDLINIGRNELMLNPKYKVTIVQDVKNDIDNIEVDADLKPHTYELKELIPFTDKECCKKGFEIIASRGLKSFSYTKEELESQQVDQAKNELIAKAQILLNQNDYRQTKAIGGMYSDNKAKAVLEYMEALRKVIREAKLGNLTELPILDEIE